MQRRVYSDLTMASNVRNHKCSQVNQMTKNVKLPPTAGELEQTL